MELCILLVGRALCLFLTNYVTPTALHEDGFTHMDLKPHQIGVCGRTFKVC